MDVGVVALINPASMDVGEPMNAYCVILCRRQDAIHQPRFKRFYIGAPTADRALVTASDHHPHFRVMGIEHSDVSSRVLLHGSDSDFQAA
jgi:hypothetical protein